MLPNHRPPSVVAAVARGVTTLAERTGATPRALGLAVAAQVDPTTGTVRYAPNLRWRDVAFGPMLERALAMPVTLENDARAATWGEWRHGSGRGDRDLFVLIVGTGVGGGAVVDGRWLGGAAHAAGEIGHLTVVTGGAPCHCPNRGCLEAYVGGWAIADRARARIADAPSRRAPLLTRAGALTAIDATTVTRSARDGDPLSLEIMDEVATHLEAGAVGIVNAFNPARLLLGGGLVEGWPELVPRVRAAVLERCQPPAARAVEVGATGRGAEAPLVGAADLAWRRLRSVPRPRRNA